MTLKQLLEIHHYPQLVGFVERLEIRAEHKDTVDGVDAMKMLDEIRHLAVAAFHPKDHPR